MTGAARDLITRVDATLGRFLAGRDAAFATLGDDLAPIAAAARASVLDGGKRLRPAFAYWGWRAAGGNGDDDALITAAASMELLHACALVHDDVMDASDTRRGRPAAHRAFASVHVQNGWAGDPEAFGAAAAILLGDLLLSWSDAMFTEADLPADRVPAARAVFDNIRQVVMAGQYLDVLVQARGDFSVDEALRVIRFKTSKYTVEGPLHLGAAIAGGDPDLVASLSRFGLPLGEAFQLRDDVLGVFGDPEVTGKPAGDDLREGKQTLLTALAMERADDGQAALLRRDLGARDLAGDRLEALRAVVVDTGALDEVEKRIALRADEALAELDGGPLDPSARGPLAALVDLATRRRS